MTSRKRSASRLKTSLSEDNTGFWTEGRRASASPISSPCVNSAVFSMRSAVPFSRKTVRPAASAAATSSRLASGWVRASAASSPSPSMSKAERAPKWAIRSVICAGHPAWFGQRRSTSPSFWGASFVPHEGQFCGMTKGYSLPSRAATTGATISGITSPAFRKTTRSPIRTPLRATSLALCKVARET